MLKIVLSTLTTMLTFGALASPAVAEPHHYALEFGAGLNTITPYGVARVHFMPESLQALSMNASFQVGEQFSKTNSALNLAYMGTLGGRYYLIQEDWFQPFLSADVGFSTHSIVVPSNLALNFFGLLGVGSDFMLNDSLALSVAVSSDLGILSNGVMSGTLRFRPEVGLKWMW